MRHETVVETTGTRPAIFKLLREDRFFRRMADLHQLIARKTYKFFSDSGFTHGHDLEDWLRAESETLKSIPLEVSKAHDAITVKAAVPGHNTKDIEIHVGPQCVFISRQQQEKSQEANDKIIHFEQYSNWIFGRIDLPAQIDPERVKAILGKGELVIELPKVKAGGKVSIGAKASA